MSANLDVIQDQGGLGTKSQAGDHHDDQNQDEHFDEIRDTHAFFVSPLLPSFPIRVC